MQPLLNLGHYSSICVRELRKTLKDFNQNSRCPGQDSKLALPKYKPEVFPVGPTCSVPAYPFTWTSHQHVWGRVNTESCISKPEVKILMAVLGTDGSNSEINLKEIRCEGVKWT
jgi:hypothetical protein